MREVKTSEGEAVQNTPIHWRLSFKQHAGSFGGLLTAKEYGRPILLQTRKEGETGR